jgi:hypothetical protein
MQWEHTLFCSVYIDWCTVSYLLYLFACVYLCATIDGTQFEVPHEPSFEDVPEQQQFIVEGKWSLIILQSQ